MRSAEAGLESEGEIGVGLAPRRGEHDDCQSGKCKNKEKERGSRLCGRRVERDRLRLLPDLRCRDRACSVDVRIVRRYF